MHKLTDNKYQFIISEHINHLILLENFGWPFRRLGVGLLARCCIVRDAVADRQQPACIRNVLILSVQTSTRCQQRMHEPFYCSMFILFWTCMRFDLISHWHLVKTFIKYHIKTEHEPDENAGDHVQFRSFVRSAGRTRIVTTILAGERTQVAMMVRQSLPQNYSLHARATHNRKCSTRQSDVMAYRNEWQSTVLKICIKLGTLNDIAVLVAHSLRALANALVKWALKMVSSRQWRDRAKCKCTIHRNVASSRHDRHPTANESSSGLLHISPHHRIDYVCRMPFRTRSSQHFTTENYPCHNVLSWNNRKMCIRWVCEVECGIEINFACDVNSWCDNKRMR